MSTAHQPTVFISRNLEKNSVFKKHVAAKAKVIGLSLIEFKAVPFGNLPVCDWLFFYSKKGIYYCLSQLDALDNLPPIGVIGEASANYLWTKYQLRAAFVGTGHPEETALAFSALVQGKKVVFAQAQHSKQSVQQLLGKNVISYDVITYQNKKKVDFQLPPIDVLVFTSPLNVTAYFDQYAYHSAQKIISIGRVTAKALENLGIEIITIAEAPNEQALAKACLQIIQ